MDSIECIVIGAGVVGLAVAKACAEKGLETILLEQSNAIGTETSSRNSEVIHAGIYYPKNSLKAKLCVKGRDMLYEYCDTNHIEYKRCGKLIVASTADQASKLKQILQAGIDNDVTDLKWLDQEQANILEPDLNCKAAILSPSTGIIDSHSLMVSLLGGFEAAGGLLAYSSPVLSGHVLENDSHNICLNIGDETSLGSEQNIADTQHTQIKAKYVINCAGLYAIQLAHSLNGLTKSTIPQGRYAKGNYYAFSGKPPFKHLIYPVPQDGGLGVHLTLDLAGRAKFGPDVEWIDEIDYSINPDRANSFYKSIRSYWPELPDDSLQADYVGIRPKLISNTKTDADFMIQDWSEHKVAGLINLYGIESPGLTAALAIGEHVANKIK